MHGPKTLRPAMCVMKRREIPWMEDVNPQFTPTAVRYYCVFDGYIKHFR